MRRILGMAVQCLFGALFLGFLISLVAAQVAYSNIAGEVKDSTGAVIVDAAVEVLNTATGISRSDKTAADGSFAANNLPPGPYRITVSKTGFGPRSSELTLLVGQTPKLSFTLSPSASEKIEVVANASMVDVSSSTLEGNVAPQEVTDLPINGRDFATLATLVPGVTTGQVAVDKNYDPVKRNVAAISVNGTNGRNLYMTIDGGDNTDIFQGGQNIQLSVEAVQEFQVITHDPKAQFGRGIGGIVNVVTKSGGNSLHGTVFGFFREAALQSEDAISRSLGKPKPPFDSQQFGATIGGPIVKKKLFGFYSYERDMKKSARVFNSGGAFPSLDGTNTSQPFRQNLHLVRIDGQISPQHSVYGRYAEQGNRTANEFFSQSDAPDSAANETNKLHDISGGWTWVISTDKVNDVRYHYQFWQNDIRNQVSSNDAPTIILPAATFGASQAGSQAPKETMDQISDNFSWNHGRHSFRLGFDATIRPHIGTVIDFRHNRYRFANNDYDPATNTIGATNQALNYRSFSSPAADVVNRILTHYGWYAQDDWRLHKLNISFGLRYDYIHNLYYNRGTLAETLVRDNLGQFPGSPRHAVPRDEKDLIAPRIGLNYDVYGDGRLLLRAGFARMFDEASTLADTLYADLEVTQANGNPPFNFDFVPGAFFGLLGIPCATTPCQPAVYDAGALPFSFPIGYVISPDLHVPRSDQFTAGIAYQAREGPLSGMIFEVNGVFARTHRLLQGRNLNFCVNKGDLTAYQDCLNGSYDPNGVNFPQAGPNDPITNIPRQVFLQDGTGRSDYTAMMLSVRRRFQKRWNLAANYTLSRAIADTAMYDYVVLKQLEPNAAGELGPTNFDERHRLVMTASVVLPVGFEYSTILQAATARPYTAGSSGDANGDGVPTVFGAITNGPSGSRTFNIAEGDRVGSVGALRGDPTFTWDMRVTKHFSLERFLRNGEIQLMAEVFNITNKANYGQNYFDNVDDPTRFGKPINIITPPRTAQFGLRFTF